MVKPNPKSFLGLVHDVEVGRLQQIYGYGLGSVTSMNRWCGTTLTGPCTQALDFINWSAPHFAFGHLLDRCSTDFIGGATYDTLLEKGTSRIADGGFSLPFPSCSYVYQCVEDEQDFERTYCVVLRENGGVLEGRHFIKQHGPRGIGWDYWTLDCAAFSIGPASQWTLRYTIPRPLAPASAIAMLTAKAESIVKDVIVSTELLMSPLGLASQRRVRGAGVSRYNRQYSRDHSLISHPIIVNGNRAALSSVAGTSAAGSGSGKSKAGHFRRAHVRVLWRGTPKERQVQVNSATVKGGRPMQSYQISPLKKADPAST